eukprot:TRINITY_DN387_c0_g1_i1.p1 TRINITY_DN387_c0_g1~~TRINITY_DN387_c0_g1_i1.p1  ORF type:complete len:147 (-),score=30.65 TRINITY_DN387_c0_g1_i1:64-504(-)
MSTSAAAPAKTEGSKTKQVQSSLRKAKHSIQRRVPRLYVRAIFTGYRRGKSVQHVHTALLKLENVKCREDAFWYLGKKACYIYKVPSKFKKTQSAVTKKKGPVRVSWGKIVSVHGGNGLVRAQFRKNLPPHAIGNRVRVMLYPSHI